MLTADIVGRGERQKNVVRRLSLGGQMPISLATVASQIRPASTALVLGAGASGPSGAPTSGELATELWPRVARSEPPSDALQETATILERRYDRKRVVDVIVTILGRLQPTGGILAIPKFSWKKMFT